MSTFISPFTLEQNPQFPKVIVSVAAGELAGRIINPSNANSDVFNIVEYPPPSSASQDKHIDLSKLSIPRFAAVSYPWRDLQLPKGQTVPSFHVAGALHADPISIDVLRTACGLVRLARLDDNTTWIDRAWTLQEAVAPKDETKIKIVFQLSHPNFHSFILHRCEVEGYNETFRNYISSVAESDCAETAHGHGSFVDRILEPGRSVVCDIGSLQFLLEVILRKIKQLAPEIAQDPERFPIRILRAAEAQMLYNALLFRGFRLWSASYTHSSSRAVDMVFSLMELFGVRLDVSRFGEHDRVKAMIALIQALMKRHGREFGMATWLFIAPAMEASKELSTLPQMPETSESGRAYIHTCKGRVLAFEAIGGGGTNEWNAEGAPKGEMTDSGYFVFWGKAVLIEEARSPYLEVCPRLKTYDDRETWAIVVGNTKNYSRNPDTWRPENSNPTVEPPSQEGLVELTLMMVEKHGYDLFHRVGMEREIDERKTIGWNWTYRRFQVGGPGRGERKRFAVFSHGMVYRKDMDDEEEDDNPYARPKTLPSAPPPPPYVVVPTDGEELDELVSFSIVTLD
ncbi:hypothetical protein K435DRAFT_966172 [Dendrothele bispora CBS 962.96]|uniref:Heterokaryon incompatibility domain-containing protein n=1 Tax=Dendrothele bispora (strain CBS 962.96) TaxID=1314807 RepID=A0A4S8M1Q7_DENBC|nr:hypothetical protein K435DRAFT_966172 [Dendrothele bispora CBS 962.96]